MEIFSLQEIIEKLDTIDGGLTIYAEEPWGESSAATVGPNAYHSKSFPEEAKQKGLQYFLEVFIAQEVLAGFVAQADVHPSLNQKCKRIIYYASYDA